MYNNNSKIIFIVSIVTLALSFGVLLSFVKIIKNKNEHAQAVINVIEVKTTERRQLNVLNDNFDNIQSLQEEINSYFIDSSKTQQTIDYINKLGIDNNINLGIKNLKISKIDKNLVLIDLDLNGKFANIIQVINLLENAPYSIKINLINLNKDILKKSYWNASVSFSILRAM